MCSEHLSTVDLVGIGFGPSNLALAIALEEHNRTAATPITAQFFERRDRFQWHPGMLLPGATMQVSFLKDLATQRNTASDYTFLKYLAERDRLTDFINLQTFFPLRSEFHDYLQWAAARVSIPVQYSSEVTSVRWHDGAFEVRTPTAACRARHLVLGGGIRAKLPAGVVAGRRVFHNHDVLDRFAELPESTHGAFAVIGAGQSAAEVTAFLHQETDAQVHAVFAKYGYTPADDSPYANRIFDPGAVDDYFAAQPAWRERILTYHRGTNYSAVDPELINELYRREYTERVDGHRRLFVHGCTEVLDVAETDDAARLRVVNRMNGEELEILCDAVVFATGFEPTSIGDMLGDLGRFCHADVHGRPVLDRSYRLRTDPEVTGAIYVQGNSEHTHGLTATLLSNVAVRSGEIVESLSARVDAVNGTGRRAAVL
ncbi:SidA/IucD/PvdA family monooxygenase [Gordonia sp. N1V]|uniref:lysine N(6)-hydroxylase/L-ornithine N(5)-oxygenase family protein n=1 Tax=Gordonia sp. N1V TaxID=3034163 RepID=UPI0023E2CFBA|nr:SidA/IucD/PvdA family monooxygenase [Gordonia sp. N1V]MDF3281866.1 SidA/IucD/PvdA family monooxygenase [Gordonia sp. N1V]